MAWTATTLLSLCAHVYACTHMFQERLVALYRRSRARRLCWKVLHAWHHQSVYGRVEGLYTRPQLITSLGEERDHVAALTTQVASMAEALQVRAIYVCSDVGQSHSIGYHAFVKLINVSRSKAVNCAYSEPC